MLRHGRDWSVCVCVCVEVGKMAKDIGMTIRKGIVVPFLPCLVAFWGFHPYVLSFFLMFFLLLVSVVFCGEEKGMNGIYMVWLCGVDERY